MLILMKEAILENVEIERRAWLIPSGLWALFSKLSSGLNEVLLGKFDRKWTAKKQDSCEHWSVFRRTDPIEWGDGAAWVLAAEELFPVLHPPRVAGVCRRSQAEKVVPESSDFFSQWLNRYGAFHLKKSEQICVCLWVLVNKRMSIYATCVWILWDRGRHR